jgi:ribonuclease E
VTLKSGGYIVINQTEALVAIDVNSGRSTREHNIEDTAYQTNLEAADEVARQMRLRDLAGLIVIDFIDMEEKRNNRSVERRLKEALKNDRARIQVGRISHFGLLEMSRQRIRTGVLESTTELCPHCQGTGHVRSPSSVALHVLRSIEDNLLKGVTHDLIVHTRTAVALYILNQKRAHLSELEQRFGLSINITADETVNSGAHFVLERGEPVGLRPVLPTSIRPTSVQLDELIEEEEPEVEEIEAEETAEAAAENGDGERRKRRRRRRRRGNGDHAGHAEGEAEAFAAEDEAEEPQAPAAGDEAEEEPVAAAAGDQEGESAEGDGDEGPRRRRRGRRGGRRSRRGQGEDTAEAQADEAGDDETLSRSREIAEAITEAGEALPDEIAAPALEPAEAAADEPPVEDEAEREPVNGAAEPAAAPEPAEDLPPRPKRGGWWQRRSFF